MDKIGRYKDLQKAEMTRLEAIEAIEQSKRLLWAIERLLDKANKALEDTKPSLRVVQGSWWCESCKAQHTSHADCSYYTQPSLTAVDNNGMSEL